MQVHGISGSLNMLFGHLAWLSHAELGFLLPAFLHTPCLWLFYASTPVVAFTAYHMGSVAMGTVRVDAVYKVGAILWFLPLLVALERPLDMDRNLRLLGYAQAFCFVRLMSPVSFLVVDVFSKRIGMAAVLATDTAKLLRWDIAASCGIITGMLLGVSAPLNGLLMAFTMAVGFAVMPLLFSADKLQYLAPGQDGSARARKIDRDILARVMGS
jgi:hypothetical protein